MNNGQLVEDATDTCEWVFIVDMNTEEPIAVALAEKSQRRHGKVWVSHKIYRRQVAVAGPSNVYVNALHAPWTCRLSYAKKWHSLIPELPLATEIASREYFIDS